MLEFCFLFFGELLLEAGKNSFLGRNFGQTAEVAILQLRITNGAGVLRTPTKEMVWVIHLLILPECPSFPLPSFNVCSNCQKQNQGKARHVFSGMEME